MEVCFLIGTDDLTTLSLQWNLYNNKQCSGYPLLINELNKLYEHYIYDNITQQYIYITYYCCIINKQRTIIFKQTNDTDNTITNTDTDNIDHDHYQLNNNYQYQLYLSIQSIGLSIINQFNQELLYLTCNDTPSKWFVHVSRKWKQLPNDIETWCEQQYQSK